LARFTAVSERMDAIALPCMIVAHICRLHNPFKHDRLGHMSKSINKRLRRPSDPVELAKLVGDIATGQVKDEQVPPPTSDDVRRVMSMLGKIGGPKGGAARAEALTKKRRIEIAKAAALARWGKKNG
jgi:hypothetical protein